MVCEVPGKAIEFRMAIRSQQLNIQYFLFNIIYWDGIFCSRLRKSWIVNNMYKSATPMKPNRYTAARLIKTVMGSDTYCLYCFIQANWILVYWESFMMLITFCKDLFCRRRKYTEGGNPSLYISRLYVPGA